MTTKNNTEKLHVKVSKKVKDSVKGLVKQHINGVLCESMPDVLQQLVLFYEQNKEDVTKEKDGKVVKSRTAEAVETRISSVVNAIIDHNNNTKNPREKWFISRSLLRNYTFSVGDNPLDNFLEKHKDKLEKHHNKHKIDVSINNKIRNKSTHKRGFVGKKPVLKDMYDIIEKAGLAKDVYKGLPFSNEKS